MGCGFYAINSQICRNESAGITNIKEDSQMRLTKKIASAVLALTLALAVSTSGLAATWGSYFGATEGWYEGAEGALSKNTNTAFTANLDTVGWGGVWGCQVFKDSGIKIKKGKTYTLSFTAKATNVNKFIYIKVSQGETLAFNDWVELQPNKAKKYSATFTAKANATSIYFAMGGDAGDRSGVTTDVDADIRYAALGEDYAQKLALDAGGDFTAATQITVSNFKLEEAKPAKVKWSSLKAGKKTAKVKIKKAANATGYQIEYKVAGKKAKKVDAKKKTTYTIKRLTSGKKVTVRVRGYLKAGKSKIYGAWSSKKTVRVK